MNLTVVPTLLTDLLASTVAVITSPPTRRFVAHGGWAHDCDCVAVRLGDIALEPAGLVSGPAASLITLYATVLRCVATADDTGTQPTAAAIQADALLLAADAAALVKGLDDRWGAGTLFPNVAEFGCGSVQFAAIRPVGNEGGLGGYESTIILRS